MDTQALLKEYVDECGAAGAAVGVIENGKTSFFFYGKKCIGTSEEISRKTLFEIGSISKVFTTLALMDMVSKGEVQLDDPIELYLPELKIPEMHEKKITLRHLATHHSGLPTLPTNFNPKDSLNPFADYSVEDLYQFLGNYTLTREPGQQFEYSNLGMGLLGHILSRHTGQSYESLIKSRICQILGMNRTTITIPADMQNDFATGYFQKQERHHFDIPTLAGAGAIRSTIEDMCTFLSANMALLNSPITKLLTECHKLQGKAESIGGSVGLGWMIYQSNEALVTWHNGGTGGFRSFLGFNLEAQKGIVVLANSFEEWTDAFALSFLDPETYKKASVDETLAQDLEYLKRFEGSYETHIANEKLELLITVSDSQLLCKVPGLDLVLLPEKFGIFSLKGMANQKLRFLFDASGTILKGEIVFPNQDIAAEITPIRNL